MGIVNTLLGYILCVAVYFDGNFMGFILVIVLILREDQDLGFVPIHKCCMNKNAIPPERYGEIASYLGGIPQYTFNQFLNLLLYLHFILTGEKKEITDAFGLNASQYHSLVGQQYSEVAYHAREEGIQHGTYHFEQQMLELIKNGEPEKLNAFLLAAANTANTR